MAIFDPNGTCVVCGKHKSEHVQKDNYIECPKQVDAERIVSLEKELKELKEKLQFVMDTLVGSRSDTVRWINKQLKKNNEPLAALDRLHQINIAIESLKEMRK